MIHAARDVPPPADVYDWVDGWHDAHGCCDLHDGVCCVCDDSEPCENALDAVQGWVNDHPY